MDNEPERKTATMLSFQIDPEARDVLTGADPIRVRYAGRFAEFEYKLGSFSHVQREHWTKDKQGIEDMFRRITQSEADAVLNGEIVLPDLQQGEYT